MDETLTITLQYCFEETNCNDEFVGYVDYDYEVTIDMDDVYEYCEEYNINLDIDEDEDFDIGEFVENEPDFIDFLTDKYSSDAEEEFDGDKYAWLL